MTSSPTAFGGPSDGTRKEAAMLQQAVQAARQWMNVSYINGLKKKAAPERTAFSC
jgi:hypothetical protein